MLMRAGFLLLAVAVFQVSTEFVEPEFIGDVIKRESESATIRIVSGWEAIPGQHPHQAALRMVDAAGGVSACGGSFVHREWAITAAHCTALRVTIVVRGGVVSLTTPEYIFETTQWWNHPSYNDNMVNVVQPNDISLMKLQRPITYTRNLKAIRIQPMLEAFRNYDGELVHTSGHGRTWTGGSTTEVLRWVYLRAVSNPTCQATFGTLITANSICARWFNVTSQSVCQGDSGGPLVHVNSQGVETLIGVTSFVAGGDWGCHSGLPAGFIRPGPFLPWFKEISGIDFENLQEDEDDITEAPTTPEPESEEVTNPPPEEDEEDTTDPPSGEDDEITTQPPTQPEEDEDDTTTTTPTPPEVDNESEEGGGSSEEDKESSDSSESSESSESNDDDCETSELMKRLQVKVKVKVTLNKFKVKKDVHKEKEKRH